MNYMFSRPSALALLFSFVLAVPVVADTEKFPKATSPQLTVEYLEKFFEEDNVEAVLSLYAEDSMYIFPPGAEPIVGLKGIRRLVEGFEKNGRNVKLNLRHVHQNGDTALVVVDWIMQMRGKDGDYKDLSGTAVDVLRRNGYGHWYYYIDNPFGSAEAK